MLEPTDGELVATARAGDGRAFDALVSRYRSRVYYLVLSKVQVRETALDLAQDTFVQAYLSLSTLRDPERFASWTAAIASNVCASYLRRRTEVLLPSEAIEELFDPRTGPVDDATDAHDILYSLPEGTRNAAVLYFIDEMKMTEIAEFLGISLSAVKSRIRDTRARFEKEMVYMVKRTAKKEEPGDEFNRSLSRRLELARWYRQLGELFDSGMNIRSALARLMQADYSDAIKKAAKELDRAVASGTSIADALTELPALVAPDTVPIMRAGETGGILPWAAAMLADRIQVEEARQDIDLIFWCRALASMLSAGVPAVEALARVAEISRSKRLSEATRAMADGIRQEQTMWDVMGGYTDVFPPKVRVAVFIGGSTGITSVALEWAGTEIALGICRHLVGEDVDLPSSDSSMIRPRVKYAADSLVTLLTDKDPAIRAAAAEMLGRFKVASAATEIAKLVEDPAPEVMKAAMRALAALETTPSADTLAERLKNTDPSVRRAAVQSLSELKLLHQTADSVADLIADPDERVANEALSALETGEEMEALGKWAGGMIRDAGADPRNREKAAQILFKHPSITIPEAVLLKALHDHLPAVRCAAAKALAHQGNKRAVPALIEAVKERRLSQDYLFLAYDREKG